MRPNRNVTITALIFAMVTVLVLPAQASEWELSPSSERQAIADVSVQPGVVTMTPNVPFKRVRLVISGPAGVVFDKLYTEAPITWHVEDLKGKALADGRYDFELRFDLGSVEKGSSDASEVSSLKAAPVEQSRAVSGAFSVKNGTIDTAYRSNLPKLDPEALRQPMEAPGLKAFDDDFLFVQSKIGIGIDDSNIVPDAALHIQENSPTGILLEERGGNAVSPDPIEGQWRIRGTDTNFTIGHDPNNSATERENFVIEEGAEANALYLDSSGALGLGTNTPFGSIEVSDPQFFTQMSFTANGGVDFLGSLEMRSDTNNITIEGATEQDIIQIHNEAPAQRIVMNSAGLIGLGTASPTQALDVFSSSTPRSIVVRNTNPTAAERIMFNLINNGKARFVIENTQAAKTWTFDNDGNFTISQVGTGLNEFSLTGAGNLTIRGTLTQGSDVNAKTEIEPVNELEILERVIGLPIAEWSYKDDGPSVRHIGPMAQDFYDTFSVGESRTGISSIDTGGVALAAIQGLHRQVEDLEQENAELKQRLAAIEAALASLK
jgi:hypothetical protein